MNSKSEWVFAVGRYKCRGFKTGALVSCAAAVHTYTHTYKTRLINLVGWFMTFNTPFPVDLVIQIIFHSSWPVFNSQITRQCSSVTLHTPLTRRTETLNVLFVLQNQAVIIKYGIVISAAIVHSHPHSFHSSHSTTRLQIPKPSKAQAQAQPVCFSKRRLT